MRAPFVRSRIAAALLLVDALDMANVDCDPFEACLGESRETDHLSDKFRWHTAYGELAAMVPDLACLNYLVAIRYNLP